MKYFKHWQRNNPLTGKLISNRILSNIYRKKKQPPNIVLFEKKKKPHLTCEKENHSI